MFSSVSRTCEPGVTNDPVVLVEKKIMIMINLHDEDKFWSQRVNANWDLKLPFLDNIARSSKKIAIISWWIFIISNFFLFYQEIGIPKSTGKIYLAKNELTIHCSNPSKRNDLLQINCHSNHTLRKCISWNYFSILNKIIKILWAWAFNPACSCRTTNRVKI